jgi:hypothetical protein
MAGIKPFNLLTDSLRLAYNPLLQGLLLGVDLVRYPLFIAETDTGRIRQQISLLSNFILDYNVKIPWVLNNRLGLNFVWRAPLWGETGGFMRRGETDQVYKNAAQQFNFGLGFYPAESTIGADGDVNEVLRTLNSCSFQVYLGKNVWASETGRSYIDLYTAGGKTTCHF